MAQRPDNFTLNMQHPLAQGLVFAGLGAHAGSTRYHDSSVYGNHGTLTNMDTATDWIHSGTTQRTLLEFGGTSQYVGFANKPIFPSLIQWSVSMWLRTDTTAASNGWFFAEANAVSPNSINGVMFRRNGSGLYIHSYTSGATAAYYLASGFFTSGELIHLCVTCPGSSAMSVYKNGALATGFTNTGIYAAPTQTTNALTLGRATVNTFTFEGYFDGGISDPLIHNWPLAIPAIKQLADPSNVMLSGLINYPRRKWWPVVSAAPPASTARNLVLGGGVL